MTRRRFQQVDVFGAEPLAGNPLAVVVDSDGLDTETMARIARWIDLSETTFLAPPTDPGADYAVRIFTPAGELPFAGHPTLGSAAVWLAAGGRPATDGEIVQACGIGNVRVRARPGGGFAFAAPPLIRSGEPDDADVERAAARLSIDIGDVVEARWIDNGPGWMGVLLADADAVLALGPVGSIDPDDGMLAIGAVGPHAGGGDAYEVRAFFSDATGTVREDPVTGSLNASVAQWMVDSGRAAPPYRARQGAAMGRDGVVEVTGEGDDLWIGGTVHPVIEGIVDL